MMPDDLDLMQLASTGALLAKLDDTDYLDCRIVLAWPVGGVPRLYCAHRDWAAMPIARLAEKNQQIAELESTLSRQAAEALKQAQRASAAEARIKQLEQQLRNAPPAETPSDNQAAPDPPPEPIICPDCGKGGWKNAHALDVHRGRAHAPAPIDQGWRCAEKGCAGAFTRDLHDPLHCTQHAQRTTNGVEVAA